MRRRVGRARAGAARDLVTGKARADEELDAFYQKVLPADLTAARRMTYAACRRWRARPNVKLRRADDSTTPEPTRTTRLGRLQIRMVLEGEYENLRQFIYELESAPEFVIIDDVTLVEGRSDEAADADARSVHLLPRCGANGA